MILSGGYRVSGNLPCEEMRVTLDKRRNAICKHRPERQASGRICCAGEVCKERSLNIYDSHTTPRYAGYAQGAYANSIAQQISKKEREIQNFNSVLLIAISFMREGFESVRSTKKEIGTHKECR